MLRGKLILDDVHFKLGIRLVHGIIHAEQGIPAFYVPGQNIIMRIPGPVTAEQYETEVTACLRLHADEFVYRITEDDCDVEDLAEREDYLDVSCSRAQLLSMLEEQKLRKIPQVAGGLILTVLGIIGSVILVLLKAWKFLSVSGLLLIVGLFIQRYWTNTLNSNVVYDAYDHWVDLDTGQTNLSGGYKIPDYE